MGRLAAIQDSEYSILIYSEKKPNYLMNAGYLGEQLDLYLVRNGIGFLWYGLGKADEPSFDGLEDVIMITVHKVSDGSLFRKDIYFLRDAALAFCGLTGSIPPGTLALLESLGLFVRSSKL